MPRAADKAGSAGRGAAEGARRKVKKKRVSNRIAMLRAKKASGQPLSPAQEKELRAFAQSTDAHQ